MCGRITIAFGHSCNLEEETCSTYKRCTEIHPLTAPIHSLVTRMLKSPNAILNEYGKIRSESSFGSFDFDPDDFIRLVPNDVKRKMTEKQIVTHNDRLAFIPADTISQQKRPILIIQSYEEFI